AGALLGDADLEVRARRTVQRHASDEPAFRPSLVQAREVEFEPRLLSFLHDGLTGGFGSTAVRDARVGLHLHAARIVAGAVRLLGGPCGSAEHQSGHAAAAAAPAEVETAR